MNDAVRPGTPRHVNRKYFAVALVIAAPVLFLFGPALLTDRSLAFRDAAHFYHPLLEWTSSQWLSSGPPLWNPYENSGMPLLADASSGLFYPGRLLLALPIDFTWRYKIYVVAHVPLAALGSYLLARHWRASPHAAAMAAISFACSGIVVFQHANAVFLISAAWLPFGIWATDRALVQRSWRAAVALGVVLSLMILGGDPQAAIHVLLAAGLYAVIGGWGACADETSAAPDVLWYRGLMVRFGLMALAAACGFALSAVQVLPSSEAAASSERSYYKLPRNVYEAAAHVGRGGAPESGRRWREAAEGLFGQPEATTHHERAYDFSVPPWRLPELVWPNVGGRMFPAHRRWMSLIPAEGRIWTPTLYMGLVPLVLALAQWRVRRTESSRAWLSWLLLLTTLGSFGWYGLGWLMRESYAAFGGNAGKVPIGSPVGGFYWLMVTFIPTYVNFRYPAKLLVFAALASSQLAARGIDESLAAGSTRLESAFKRIGLASVVLLVGSWLGFSWLNQQIERRTPLGERTAKFLASQADPSLGPFDLAGSQRDVYLALAQATLVCVAAAWLWRQSRSEAAPRWRWGIVALAAIDVAAANYWLIATAPADIWRTRPSAALAMSPGGREPGSGDDTRVFRASLMRWRPPSFRTTRSAHRLAQIAAWERDTLFPKYGLNHGISLVESYGSLKPVDHESLFFVARNFGPAQPRERARELPHPSVLRLLGTQYLVLPEHWQPAMPGKPQFATKVEPPAEIELAEGAAIWRLHDPLPRAWIVHDVQVLPPLTGRSLAAVDERTREVLFPLKASGAGRTVRDFRKTAVVETGLPLDVPIANGPVGQETCSIRSYSLHRVEVEATLAAPGLVVLSDMYAPGWTATVKTGGTSREATILRTNRICRGITLHAGQHVIAYEYRPLRFVAGAWLSVFGWLTVVVVLVIPNVAPRCARFKSGSSPPA